MESGEQRIEDIDLATFEGATRYLKEVVGRGVRLNMIEHGYLAPVAFVLATRNPETGEEWGRAEPVPVMGIGAMQSEETKDLFAKKLAEITKKCRAVGLLQAYESWTHDDLSYYMFMRNVGVPPEKIPGCREVVSITMEHFRAKSPALYIMDIKRDESGKVVDMGEPLARSDGSQAGGKNEGRFGNLLYPVN